MLAHGKEQERGGVFGVPDFVSRRDLRADIIPTGISIGQLAERGLC
jgi:hypothetical protein